MALHFLNSETKAKNILPCATIIQGFCQDLCERLISYGDAEWGRRAMERAAERYSWDRVTDQYEALLLTLR
jgi:glycosyltransferase involved in cell wall biosynthesis